MKLGFIIISLSFTGISISSLARNKVTFSSSNGGGSLPSRAVDGSFSPQWGAASCWESNIGDMNPYWMVDLEDNYYINYVTVTNRADCCAGRLHSVQMLLYAENPLQNSAATSTLCAFFPGPLGAGVTQTIACTGQHASGRFLKINGLNRANNNDLFHLCEVTVASLPNPVSRHLNLAKGKPTSASSSETSSSPSGAVDGNSAGWWNALSCWQALYTDANPYWMVDLEDVYHVSYVTISSRLDCCVKANSLHDVQVILYQESPLANPAAQSSLCNLYPGPATTGSTLVIMCEGKGRSGRYVKINGLNRANDGFQFCEVGVYSYIHISSQCLSLTFVCEDNKRVSGSVLSLTNTARQACIEACNLRQSCFGFNYNEGSLYCELVNIPAYELYSVNWSFCGLTLT